MTKIIDLSGVWRVSFSGERADVKMPGTLDTNGLGEEFSEYSPDRLTRKHTYTGAASFEKKVFIDGGKCAANLFIERTRASRVFVNGIECFGRETNSLATPCIFDVTDAVNFGADNLIRVVVDNSYPDMPASSIIFSSMATDETQTNWNGMLGRIELQLESEIYISSLRVYPAADLREAKVAVTVTNSSSEACECEIFIDSPSFLSPCHAKISISPKSGSESVFVAALDPNAKKWGEYEGNLYTVTAETGQSKKSVRFGVRSFCPNTEYKFSLNGSAVFIRGEANCCVFPETGFAPMEKEAWLEVLSKYKAYGVNCMRFHSHCPPEAAFDAADEMGMLMQCELSNWNCKDNFELEHSAGYYEKEALSILDAYANHPSFVMLTFGNELCAGKEGHEKMDALVKLLKETDPTRLYADSSNPHYGWQGPNPVCDFYTAQQCGDAAVRGTFADCAGHINKKYPSCGVDYSAAVRRAHDAAPIPFYSFEVGQFQVFPDFDEIDDYKGCLLPGNIMIARDRLAQKGRFDRRRDYANASGELALRCYKEEAEAALRTENLAGISLLGIQDFPGQGTALVGMMDSHLNVKKYPFAAPEKFKSFFDQIVPIAIFDKYTYAIGETFNAAVKLANYSPNSLSDCEIGFEISDGVKILSRGTLPKKDAPQGTLNAMGRICFSTEDMTKSAMLTLTLDADGHKNSYEFWVYKDCDQSQSGIYITKYLDENAQRVLERGGKVLLAPKAAKEALPDSIGGVFSTDFWCVTTFKSQQGSMGLLIDDKSCAFEDFPTQFHSNYQWWQMATYGRPMIIDSLGEITPLVEVIDTFARQNHMALLFECKTSGGSLMVSSMGLDESLDHIEARALKNSILKYMQSDKFAPKTEIGIEKIRALVKETPLL